MRAASILLGVLMLCAFKAPTIETIFEGYLRSRCHSGVSNLHVLIKKDRKIVASGVTDKRGYFEVGFNEGSEDLDPLFLCYVNRKGDTILLKKYTRLDDQITKVNFTIP